MGMNNIEELVSHCLSCPKPRCETLCPCKNHIRDFIAAAKTGDFAKAGEILYSTNPFPELTTVLCDHHRQCLSGCVRSFKGEPVQVPLIEAEIGRRCPIDLSKKPNNGRSIAFVGGGIGALSCAYFLLKEGFRVDIYEKEDTLGGAIRTGIPEHRFDKKTLDFSISKVLSLGADVKLHTEVGKDIALEELQKKYDFVILDIGSGKENLCGMEVSHGVKAGLSLLYDLNALRLSEQYAANYKKAVVWGGGNVALDCARSLVRILPEVHIVYRRSRVEMPANAVEVEDAINEGVQFDFLTNVVSAKNADDGKLEGLNLISMELGEKDASGRASFHEIPGSERFYECDLLVLAIGQKPDFSSLGVSLTENPYETTMERVYAIGDCRYGSKNIAAAIADGRELAKKLIEEN